MTQFALNMAGYINGVARRHAETTRQMFPGYASTRSPTECMSALDHAAFARLQRESADGTTNRRSSFGLYNLPTMTSCGSAMSRRRRESALNGCEFGPASPWIPAS